MKPNFTRSVFIKTMYCSLISSGILLSYNGWANDEDINAGKKKKKTETSSNRFSLNNKSVKVYPDVIKKEMHVIIKEKTEVEFFVFDTEGTLVINKKAKPDEHIKLTGLKKGFYTYHLFSGDEEKSAGKFEIR